MGKSKELYQEEMSHLKKQLTGNMLNDMQLREEMHRLEMEYNNVTPSCGLDGSECENCGS